MRHWYVVTPEYGEVEPILDDGTGPMVYGCDVVEVLAKNRRDALALGVRLMLSGAKGWKWCREQADQGLSPYGGVEVEPVYPRRQVRWSPLTESLRAGLEEARSGTRQE